MVDVRCRRLINSPADDIHRWRSVWLAAGSFRAAPGNEKEYATVCGLLLRMMTVRRALWQQSTSCCCLLWPRKRGASVTRASCCESPRGRECLLPPLLLRVPSHRTSCFCEEFRPAITLPCCSWPIISNHPSMVDPCLLLLLLLFAVIL